jgi:hypothetical protein
MSNFQGGVGPEVYYSVSAAGTPLNTFTSEASLMGGYPVPQIPATFFNKASPQLASTVKIRAYGNASDTSTAPTFTLSLRLLSSAVTWSAGGVLLGSSSAMTMQAASLTNAWWQLDADIFLRSLAAGAATSSLFTAGLVGGPAFAAPGGSIPATNISAVTSSFDATGATQYFLWLSAACGTSNAANAISLQALKVYLEN